MPQVSDGDSRVLIQLTEARNCGSLFQIFIKYLFVVSGLLAIVVSPEITTISKIKILPSKRLKDCKKNTFM